MIYLLDSNVWIAILRNKYPEVAARYGATDPADIQICSVIVAELRHGCRKSAKAAANRAILDALFPSGASLSTTQPPNNSQYSAIISNPSAK